MSRLSACWALWSAHRRLPFDRPWNLVETALQISIELNHPLYDALYLALAQTEHCQLVTADKRFLRAVQGTRYQPLVVPLVP